MSDYFNITYNGGEDELLREKFASSSESFNEIIEAGVNSIIEQFYVDPGPLVVIDQTFSTLALRESSYSAVSGAVTSLAGPTEIETSFTATLSSGGGAGGMGGGGY